MENGYGRADSIRLVDIFIYNNGLVMSRIAIRSLLSLTDDPPLFKYVFRYRA